MTTTTTTDRCDYCGRVLTRGDAPADDTICRECWHAGRWADRNLQPLLWALGQVTGTTWHVTHTGGNCFAVITATDGPDGDPDPLSGPCMVITADGDVLRGDHTLEEVNGWDLGVYPEGMDGGADVYAEDLPFEALLGYVREYHPILTTGEV